jgi:type VII secretion protein EccB
MGLRLTTKVQVSGWRFLLRRVEHAIVRRDTRMFDDPLQFYSRSVTIGIVIAVLILFGAGVLAFFKPQGKLGGGELFADGTTYQVYLKLSGRLHPVYNLTSARLILGQAADPAVVKSSELEKLPKGQWIGIPGAPYTTPVAPGASSVWALCDTVAKPTSVAPTVDTALIMMPLVTDSSVGPVPEFGALLTNYNDQDWIVTAQGRHAIDRTDRALTAALGIPVAARGTPISEGMYNALPNLGAWELPSIPNAGDPNTLGLPEDLVIGAVFQTSTPQGPKYYVVLPDSIATVNGTTAAALRARQSYGLVAPPTVDPSIVVNVAERAYISPLPDQPLQLLSRQEAPTLCWSWERKPGDQSPKTMVLAGRNLPISPAALKTGVDQIQGQSTVYTDGGRFVALQSPDPRFGESLYYIDPQGVRYGLPDKQTAGSLGLTSPRYGPWEVIRLLVDGPVLSKNAALLEHDTLPDDPNPRRLPGGSS